MNIWRVTDRAITPGSSDANIVVLAGQMGLRSSHRTGTRVPIEAGNRSCSAIISMIDGRLNAIALPEEAVRY